MCWGEVKVTQSCLTLCDPIDCTVHGILQAWIEWVAFLFSRGSSQSRDQTQVSWIAGGFFTSWAAREALLVCWMHIKLTWCDCSNATFSMKSFPEGYYYQELFAPITHCASPYHKTQLHFIVIIFEQVFPMYFEFFKESTCASYNLASSIQRYCLTFSRWLIVKWMNECVSRKWRTN